VLDEGSVLSADSRSSSAPRVTRSSRPEPNGGPDPDGNLDHVAERSRSEPS
jgi:hypothetical protein